MFGVVQSVKNNASESEYYKNDIPAHPREFGGGSLNWMLSSKFEASFEHEFQKSRPVNRANTQKLNDSHNSNAGLTFKEKSGAVKLQLVNIFDRENVDLRGNPRPPRMYEVGAELSF
jgi:hypothetical protein